MVPKRSGTRGEGRDRSGGWVGSCPQRAGPKGTQRASARVFRFATGGSVNMQLIASDVVVDIFPVSGVYNPP